MTRGFQIVASWSLGLRVRVPPCWNVSMIYCWCRAANTPKLQSLVCVCVFKKHTSTHSAISLCFKGTVLLKQKQKTKRKDFNLMVSVSEFPFLPKSHHHYDSICSLKQILESKQKCKANIKYVANKLCYLT